MPKFPPTFLLDPESSICGFACLPFPVFWNVWAVLSPEALFFALF
jgi:hypothetical protein